MVSLVAVLWILLVLPCAIADLLVFPWMAFIAPLKPSWFPWSCTPDNPVDGDSGHIERTRGWFPYCRRVWWLLRNRAYGLKLYVLGCKAQQYNVQWGNPDIKNRDDAVAGAFLLVGEHGHWYYKEVFYVGYGYCIQLALGWQLDSPINGYCLFQLSPRVTKFNK